MNKKPKNFRLSAEVREALESESQRTGRTATQIIEDRILGKKRYSNHVQKLLDRAVTETGATEDEIISLCVFENIREVVRKLNG